MEGPWAPTNTETSPDEERTLTESIRSSMVQVERLPFFKHLLKQMSSEEVSTRLKRLMGAENQMDVVTYGIGNIATNPDSRFQLSVVLLLKTTFDWIGSLEIFDPVITLKESNVMKTLGFRVLEYNEEGKRKAVQPLLFFMPYCPLQLYENLVNTNLENGGIYRMAILGSSFARFLEKEADSKNKQNLLATEGFTIEFEVDTGTPGVQEWSSGDSSSGDETMGDAENASGDDMSGEDGDEMAAAASGDDMPGELDLPEAFMAFGLMSWHFFDADGDW